MHSGAAAEWSKRFGRQSAHQPLPLDAESRAPPSTGARHSACQHRSMGTGALPFGCWAALLGAGGSRCCCSLKGSPNPPFAFSHSFCTATSCCSSLSRAACREATHMSDQESCLGTGLPVTSTTGCTLHYWATRDVTASGLLLWSAAQFSHGGMIRHLRHTPTWSFRLFRLSMHLVGPFQYQPTGRAPSAQAANTFARRPARGSHLGQG